MTKETIDALNRILRVIAEMYDILVPPEDARPSLCNARREQPCRDCIYNQYCIAELAVLAEINRTENMTPEKLHTIIHIEMLMVSSGII